jgi:hypothetical protein
MCFFNPQGLWDMRLSMNAWGIPAILPWGRTFVPFMPRNDSPLHVVVGKPLHLPHIEVATYFSQLLRHQSEAIL